MIIPPVPLDNQSSPVIQDSFLAILEKKRGFSEIASSSVMTSTGFEVWWYTMGWWIRRLL